MKKILVVGSINMDVVLRVPHIPAQGETILARGQSFYGGGKGANQAIAASRLGAKVSMIGRLGEDDYGKRLFQDLVKSDVGTQGVEFTPKAPTGTAYIYVSDQGDNNIVVNPGANGLLDIDQIKRHEHLLQDADYCILQMEIPLETIKYVMKFCKKEGIKIILNPAPAQPLEDEVLEGTFILLPNETELQILSGGQESPEVMAKNLYKKGIENVLVTLGEKGCILVNSQGVAHFPARPSTPVDTTGAGDSFVAAITTGLAEGMPWDLAIKFATYTASITISKAGAQESLPYRDLVDLHLKGHERM